VPSLASDPGRAQVHTGGALPCAEAAGQAQAWGAATRARRCWGEVDGALEGWQARQPRTPQAAAAMRQRIGFRRHRADRVPDRSARKGGSPLGRGGIEAANNRMRQVRLTRAGAWWYLNQATQMLAWRCAIDNGTFARVFEADQRRTLPRHGRNPPEELRNAPPVHPV
jgi:hypothetical protein